MRPSKTTSPGKQKEEKATLDASITTRMTDPPEILIIHLIRSRYGKNLRTKDCALVSFPETLDIREFTVGDEIPGEYHLKVVASHIGPKVDGGHYIAFCKIEEEWWN
jgi:ubiquitin C-terminal hydrolase